MLIMLCISATTSATTDEGVVIDGIRWATRNVATPGTFTENPEDFGMFFQWNRKKAWNTSDIDVDNWEQSPSVENMNELCPAGWRLPTEEELWSLMVAGSAWATLGDVPGSVFGRAPNQIFLPAAGWRDSYDGELNSAGREGSYWGNNENNDGRVLHLWFVRGNMGVAWADKTHGFSLRCVAE